MYTLITALGWHCLAGNQVLFEKKNFEELGESTVLQARLHPSQKKFFNLLGTRKSHPPLHTATAQCFSFDPLFIDRDLRGPFTTFDFIVIIPFG
jgi:hypothetical protein